MPGRFRLLVSEAWKSLGANLSTTVAATMTVLISMFLLGLFIAFGTWMNSWSAHVKRELVVKVFFTRTATRQEETRVAEQLQQNKYVLPGTGGITYVSKKDAFIDMTRRYPKLVDGVTSNPLPDSLRVKPRRGEDIEKLADSIRKPALPAGVANVQDAKQTSHRILRVAHYIDLFFILAAAILLCACVLLIANTIRLSIFSRRREIEVMKLVGATNWFVRGPFMLEGIFCGLAGAFLAIFCLILGKEILLPIIPSLTNDPDVHAMAFSLTALMLLAVGIVVGAFGSGLTMRRFLRI